MKTQEQEWRQNAACRNTNEPHAFYPGPHSGRSTVRIVKKYCAQCPVIAQCLAYCLKTEPQGRARGIRHGIWGGTTPHQREKLACNP